MSLVILSYDQAVWEGWVNGSPSLTDVFGYSLPETVRCSEIWNTCTPTLHCLQELLKLLFKVTDHNALNQDGDAPLHSFVKRRDKEKFNCLMAFLIHSKCDVNLTNREGQTALHLACEV